MSVGVMLAQSRPTDTSATQVYSPDAGVVTEITWIAVCNTTGSAATYRIFLDRTGTTYDQTTALYYDVSLAANTTSLIEAHWWMDNKGGNLAVRSGTGSAITFTIFGVEYQR